MPTPTFLASSLVSVLALISITPDPIAFHLGPVPVFWYGVCYAVGLAVTYLVITREARRRGLDARLVDNGIIIVGVAALIGGRAYHVIDQWHLYQDNLLKIVMPPYTGLGVYGGIITGTIAAWYLTRRWHQSFWRWADVVAPGIFVMEAIGRWGNFFNQELYGPPTSLPWGIAIDCAHRVGDHGLAQWPCDQYPVATTGFHPLFLYESVSGVLGALTLLWIARRWGSRMRPGDLFLIFLVWYAIVRFVLETFRMGNWTFFGVPTAMVVSAAAIVGALAMLAIRHRPGATEGDRWGEPPGSEDEVGDGEEWVEVDEDDDPDEEAGVEVDEDGDVDDNGPHAAPDSGDGGTHDQEPEDRDVDRPDTGSG
jgi:phosphatidylglycerol:prolipoprotein diacylglycerol transferase